MRELSNDEKTILILLSNALFNRQEPLNCVDDWDAILQECQKQSVALLCFGEIYDTLPDEIAAKAGNICMMIMANNMRNEYAHVEVNEILNMPYVILKGCASSHYYRNPALRSAGDVDFLIKPENLADVDRLLLAHGYEREDDLNIAGHQIAYHKGEMEIELHKKINGIPDNKFAPVISEYFDNIFDKSVTIETDTGAMMVPSDFHHGLVILLHTLHHLLTSGIGMRHLCDWAAFVDCTGDQFEELFSEKLKCVGLWKFACILTQAAYRIGLDRQEWAGDDPQVVDDLVIDIFDSGNFGNKDSERANQGKLIADFGNVGQSTKLAQLFRTMNGIVRFYWPQASKCILLYPIGWVYFSARYLWKVAKGEKPKIHLRAMIDGAEERRGIYQQFDLFKV